VDIKFCENGDKRIAIGTGIRKIRFCRPCHVAEYEAEFEAWNVVIDHRALGLEPEELMIACAKTGEDISAGIVWLDPVETNIVALVYAGYIAAIEEPAVPAVKAPKAERVTEVA
jgi:hypothetical protein